MSISLKKLWNDYGIGAILVLLILAYVVSLFANYLSSKGMYGYESNSAMQQQYKGTQSPQNYNGSGGNVVPSEPLGQNEVFSSANGVQTSMPGMPSSCSQPNIQNPAELLPKDTNSQWAQLNPSGKGELANVNLLKAGYHIGIDTIGQTLRNANLQIRSEPANPQLYVGPWNQSTIEPDFMRPPLELGSGPQ
jgi:hypothetical protein|uniref:Minor capsid protein P11 C-terminal conserved region domain-containing protein n=1 Tax=viral metagenome TaxID=1070528 RepID=A0A6C0D8F2_9ZZZZ